MLVHPVTCAFESLVCSPLEGVRFGDFAQFGQPGISMVVGDRTFSRPVRAMLKDIDVAAALAERDTKNRLKIPIGGYYCNVAPTQFREVSQALFGPLLPLSLTQNQFHSELALMLGDVSRAFQTTGQYSGHLELYLIGNRKGMRGVTHADIDKEGQGLLTLPTGGAKGTWIVDRSVFSAPFPPPLRLDGVPCDNGFNSYGRPTADLAVLVRQAPAGRVLFWEGRSGQNPQLHQEPDVLTDNQARLTLLFEPSEMLATAQARYRARTPNSPA